MNLFFEQFKSSFEKHNIPLINIVVWATNEASATVVTKAFLVHSMKEVPNILSVPCMTPKQYVVRKQTSPSFVDSYKKFN